MCSSVCASDVYVYIYIYIYFLFFFVVWLCVHTFLFFEIPSMRGHCPIFSSALDYWAGGRQKIFGPLVFLSARFMFYFGGLSCSV